MTDQWWGYQMVKDAEFAWGARAIFKPSLGDNCLDLLYDRQGHHYPENRHEEYKAFVAHLSTLYTAKCRICKNFGPEDSDKFVRHFPWPNDPNKVIVVMGSPNSSYGYFYLSASLVEKAKAPDEVKTKWELYEEERQRLLAERKAEEERQRPMLEEMRKRERQAKKQAKATLEARVDEAPHKESGEDLEVGDHFYISANQGERHAFALAVIDNEVFAEYFMPSGKKFLVVVDKFHHGVRQNISPNRVPKKWQKLLAA